MALSPPPPVWRDPLDRLLRRAMTEFVLHHRNRADRPYDGLTTAAVDLVAFARDVDRTALGAGVMVLTALDELGREPLEAGLHALLSVAVKHGLDNVPGPRRKDV